MTSEKSCGLPQKVAIFFFSAMFWLYIAKMGIFNGVVIATAVWGIYVLIRHRCEVISYLKSSQFLWLFLLLFVPVVISAIGSLTPKDSWRTVLNISRFFFIGGLAIVLTQSSVEKIRWAVLGFIALISVDAVIEWLTGYHLTGASRDRVRIMGLFQFYHLGYVLGTLTPIIFYQTYQSFAAKERGRFAWLVITACALIAIFVAGARAGWVSLLVSGGLLLLWLLIHRKISWKRVIVALGLCIVVAGGITQIPIVKNRLVNSNSASSFEVGSYEWFDKISSYRLVLWEFAWKHYQEYPVIGAGTGSFHQTFTEQPQELKGAHDEAFFPHFHGLEVLSETGTVGFICYLIVVFSVLWLLLSAPYFSVWLAVAFIAMMPINTHVAFYGSFWAVLIWVPLILGLRERFLRRKADAALENRLN
ncbi:O-antigen ligase family protein [Wohlfahrtiimonas chitiniclastica]|uniref:O-antigen ligase family protein n=1 Tax=Wohlfahrtiimonas chitiniclastica TaxID=400946 RepID=UPI001BD079A3|nr:O-antigen ligase family protein [Wohlfahrtiimonas chitiniclastica]MBS7838905.1 O-antigen ligase family protein [Wohlfahrtiimonas chitiniclastica]